MAHIKFRCTGTRIGTSRVSPDCDSKRSDNKDNSVHVQHESVIQSYKRPASTDESSVPVKRLVEDKIIEINNNDSPKLKFGSAENDLHETWSAFRKVEKSTINETRNKSDSSTATTFIAEDSHRQKLHENIRAKYESGLNKLMCNKSFIPVGADKVVSQSLGMFMSNSWMVPSSFTGQPYLERHSLNNKLANISADKVTINSGREAVGNTVEQFQNKEINKQLLFDELQNFQYSYFKPSNPMVDKLIHTTASSTMLHRPMRTLGLAQNWCAKCNASFRMTSDLVYHMRSHHKREFDPMKRKREEKLQCNVCQETFKERHHLTRHMTSHT